MLHPFGNLNNGLQVFQGFRGQADHEVELEAQNAALREQDRSTVNLIQGEIFVDHSSQALRTRLDRNGHCLVFAVPERGHQFHRNRIGSEG